MTEQLEQVLASTARQLADRKAQEHNITNGYDWVQIYCFPFIGDEVLLLKVDTDPDSYWAAGPTARLGWEIPGRMLHFPPLDAPSAEFREEGHDTPLRQLIEQQMQRQANLGPEFYDIIGERLGDGKLGTYSKLNLMIWIEIKAEKRAELLTSMPSSARLTTNNQVVAMEPRAFFTDEIKKVVELGFRLKSKEYGDELEKALRSGEGSQE